MKAAPLLVAALAFLPSISGAQPGAGLTAERTEQGVTLSWDRAPSGIVGVWRGTEPANLALHAELPSGQNRFLDFGAEPGRAYYYAIGDARSHGEPLLVPARTQDRRILAGLVTTCSALVKGRPYPADSRNYFTLGRDTHVQYFGYFLIRPFDAAPRSARIVWRDPEGRVFSEFEKRVSPRRVEIGGEPAGQVLLTQPVGLSMAVPGSGQKRVPLDAGLYAIEVLIDDEPVALTVFYLIKDGGRPR